MQTSSAALDASAAPSDDIADGEAAASPSPAAAASTPRADGAGANLALINDIEVRLSMEIGQTQISIETLLSLAPGSVVELERLADEPLDVLVNGTLVAHGEAVVVGDRFGIRLTDVVSRADRIGKLG